MNGEAPFRQILAFLTELRRLVPPEFGNQAIVFDGTRLLVVVPHHSHLQSFYLEEADLDRSYDDLARQIADQIGP